MILLRIGERSEELGRLFRERGHSCAAFITAWNPCGQLRSANENAHAQAGLRLDVLGMQTGPVVFGGESVDLAGQWPGEESLFVLGLAPDVAMELGAKYEQDAIVYVGDDLIPRLILLR